MEHAPTATRPIRVLLVEDDLDVVELIRNGLEPERFFLRHVPTVAHGRHFLRTSEVDVVVLDLNLPDGRGFEIADELRANNSSVRVLILTVHGSVDQRVNGFRHGADDYMTKPFSVEELKARLQAIVRRAHPRHILKYADISLDLLKRTVRRGDISEVLSSREMDLMVCFIQHAEQVLERDRILQEVWGHVAEEDSNVVNVYVNYLRNKLERGLYPRIIHTVRGMGYILSATDPQQPV